MTALVVCWIAFPALLGLVAQGLGVLVERVAGLDLTLGARIPCGLALLIAVLDLATRSSSTAELAVAAVVLLGAIGLGMSRPWRWRGPGPGVIAAAIVFAVFAAPVVLSGMATWSGYLKLDDTASWLALIDRALSDGHSLAGLPASSYLAVLKAYLAVGYPVGSFLPVGLGHELLAQDSAWLLDPWMGFLAGTLALALHRIAKLTLGERAGAWKAVLVAAFSAQSALLYGYYLWGGIKEVTAATLIAAFALAAPLALRGGASVRKMVPAAVVLWAVFAALSPGGFVYVAPGSLLALLLWGALWLLRGGRAHRVAPRAHRTWAVWLLPLAAVGLGVYLVLRPGGFFREFQGSLTSESELGNLIRPLNAQQLAGIWPTGDFRFPPEAAAATHALVALAFLLALLGLLLALRDGRQELVLYVLCALSGALIVDLVGSPWLGGKALASASPAVPLTALTALLWPGTPWQPAIVRIARRASGRGAAVAGAERWRDRLAGAGARHLCSAVGVLGIAAIVFGIGWSNVLAYRDVNLAPRAQFQELAEIGTRIAGQGPTLMTEYQPYGTRHFLRGAAPEAPSELRVRRDPLISGRLLEPGAATEIDQIRLSSVLVYRTVVLQRSPLASRPPAPYRLVFADEYWEVWQRPLEPAARVLWQLPLGDATRPGGVVDCRRLRGLARGAGVRALVGEPTENPLVVALAESAHPAGWSTPGPWLTPSGDGRARLTVKILRGGRYSVWLGGSTRGSLSVYVDGRRSGEALDELQEAGQYLAFGQAWLSSGPHTVELRYSTSSWRPGVGGPGEPLGPLVLRREMDGDGRHALDRAALISVPASHASALCGRTLEWIEGTS